MRVMIVEDDLISRKWLQRFLAKWGYDVSCYPDGAQAWGALDADNSPELILVDWMMPHIDGVELCRRIRSNPRTKHSYLIMLTAKSTKPDLIEGLEAGADDYLVKPVDPDELKTRIRVGERALALRHELRDRVGELESLLRRHDILGEVYTQNLGPRLAEPVAEPVDQPVAGPAIEEAAIGNLESVLRECFEQIGWGPTRRVSATPVSPDTIRLSSALIQKESDLWVDFAFDVSPESAVSLFQRMTGRVSVDGQELSEGLSEAIGIIQNGLRKASSAQGITTFAPYVPAVTPVMTTDAPDSATRTMAFELGGATLALELKQRRVATKRKKVTELVVTDVLGETSVVIVHDGEVTLREGRVPTPEALRRLSDIEAGGTGDCEVRTLVPEFAETRAKKRRLFDPDGLLERTEGDAELSVEMVRCFLTDNATAFDEVRDAIDRGDWEIAASSAHSLKGSVSYFSRGVADAVALVEDAVKNADTTRANRVSGDVQVQLAQLLGELSEFVDEPSSAAG